MFLAVDDVNSIEAGSSVEKQVRGYRATVKLPWTKKAEN